MNDDASPIEPPTPEADVMARRRAAAARALARHALGDWTDPTDVFDRQASDRARHEQSFERPPHY